MEARAKIGNSGQGFSLVRNVISRIQSQVLGIVFPQRVLLFLRGMCPRCPGKLFARLHAGGEETEQMHGCDLCPACSLLLRSWRALRSHCACRNPGVELLPAISWKLCPLQGQSHWAPWEGRCCCGSHWRRAGDKDGGETPSCLRVRGPGFFNCSQPSLNEWCCVDRPYSVLCFPRAALNLELFAR